MDLSLLQRLNDFFAGHDAVEDPLVAYANASELLFLAMLVLAFVLIAGPARRATRRAVVAAGLSAAVGLAVAQVVSRLVDRPRPFVSHPHAVHLFAHHAADAGFPSDHTTAAFAIGVALVLRFRTWGTVVLVLATLLAFTRVAMAIHYPTDVLGGAAIGGLSALVLYLPAVRALLNRLADGSGALLDAVVRATVGRLAPTRT
ncbi:MAG TPA: phosphatase PAP2 family protein [Baekduia sp.]|uniref:phosphatase PAP2 family protein n=1 Tax=Baekduia sp. TaxID=2600305 RepID=UPI002C9E113B|nr:phosphatase PAP2 family protein [Baekduia sp.]HMJ37571.1 phosphatase PAP2 family protein [Baekduia sp.]